MPEEDGFAARTRHRPDQERDLRPECPRPSIVPLAAIEAAVDLQKAAITADNFQQMSIPRGQQRPHPLAIETTAPAGAGPVRCLSGTQPLSRD